MESNMKIQVIDRTTNSIVYQADLVVAGPMPTNLLTLRSVLAGAIETHQVEKNRDLPADRCGGDGTYPVEG
jgi:hypothetical protein